MKNAPIKLGPLMLLLTVISICLTTLAILSFSTARADLRLAEKFARTVSVRYELEAQGQRMLGALAQGDDSQWQRDGEGRYVRTLEQDGSLLKICLEKHGDSFEIVSWIHEREWTQDTHIADLWTGS